MLKGTFVVVLSQGRDCIPLAGRFPLNEVGYSTFRESIRFLGFKLHRFWIAYDLSLGNGLVTRVAINLNDARSYESLLEVIEKTSLLLWRISDSFGSGYVERFSRSSRACLLSGEYQLYFDTSSWDRYVGSLTYTYPVLFSEFFQIAESEGVGKVFYTKPSVAA